MSAFISSEETRVMALKQLARSHTTLEFRDSSAAKAICWASEHPGRDLSSYVWVHKAHGHGRLLTAFTERREAASLT